MSAPAATTAGQPASVTVTLLDAIGNVATRYIGVVHFSSSDLSAGLPNNYTFTAADAGRHRPVSPPLACGVSPLA